MSSNKDVRTKESTVPKGRKNNMKYWEKEENLQKIYEWASKGLTLNDIANNMGIARETLWMWRKKSDHITNALHTGDKVIIEVLENALIRKATGYDYEEEEYRMNFKTGKMEKYKTRRIHYPPDTPALKYALNNKSKGAWSERIEVQDLESSKKLDKLLDRFQANAQEGSDEEVE